MDAPSNFWEIPYFYSNKSWSNPKIEHLIKNVINILYNIVLVVFLTKWSMVRGTNSYLSRNLGI